MSLRAGSHHKESVKLDMWSGHTEDFQSRTLKSIELLLASRISLSCMILLVSFPTPNDDDAASLSLPRVQSMLLWQSYEVMKGKTTSLEGV